MTKTAYDDKSCIGMTPQRLMMRTHAMCPTELPHTDRMAWMADYFLRNYYAPVERKILYECTGCGHSYGVKVTSCDCLENPKNTYNIWYAYQQTEEI